MQTEPLANLGRALVGLAIAAFGVQFFLYATKVAALAPSWPQWVPFRTPAVCAVAAFLTILGGTLALKRHARFAPLLVGLAALVWVLAANLPPILRSPRDIGIWNNGVMNVGLAGCAFLAGCASVGSSFGKSGRVLLALALIVFGTEHFYYAHFVATLVPAWAPAHLFFAYFTGVTLVAAGIAFACGCCLHPAALLSALMFLIWVAVLHAPRVAHTPHSADEWTSLFHAVAFAGASLVIAGMSRRSGGSPLSPP
jgi:uncharacterized membrane protein